MERPFDIHARPLAFYAGRFPAGVACEWPQKSILVGLDAPGTTLTCRWRVTHEGPLGSVVPIGFTGQRMPPGRITLEQTRRPGDISLVWKEGTRARRLLWIDSFDPQLEKVDLRAVWRDGDWAVAILHREGESRQGIPFDDEWVEAFPLVLALDDTESGRARWRDWLLPPRAGDVPKLSRCRSAADAGPLPADSILPAMRQAEAYGRLDLADLFLRRAIARLSPEEAARLRAAVDKDPELVRTRRMLARSASRSPRGSPAAH
jgi:hypothetical protein